MTYELIGPHDVKAAVVRIAGLARPLSLVEADLSSAPSSRLRLALEYMQHTGSFKARGACNFVRAHAEQGTLPDAGVVIASGGNAGLACAWAARAAGTRATVFLPGTAPEFKIAKLRGYSADVRLVGAEYADALAACQEFARLSGALASHAYDDPFIAAGAGTIATEIIATEPCADTIVVAVGGGGLASGIIAATEGTGIRVVAVEPDRCCALHAALKAGGPVDVEIDSIAADSLGARRCSSMAHQLASQPRVRSVTVPDGAIIAARQDLWDHRRIVVEHGGATAVAAVLSGAYIPRPSEYVVVVLCGANTDPRDFCPTADSGDLGDSTGSESRHYAYKSGVH